MYQAKYKDSELLAEQIITGWRELVNARSILKGSILDSPDLKYNHLSLWYDYDLEKAQISMHLHDSTTRSELYRVTISDNTRESTLFAIDSIFSYAAQIILATFQKIEE